MRATVSLETLRAAITTAMRDAHGHIPIAAKALGVSRRTLARWIATMPDVPRAPRGHHIVWHDATHVLTIDGKKTLVQQWTCDGVQVYATKSDVDNAHPVYGPHGVTVIDSELCSFDGTPITNCVWSLCKIKKEGTDK